MLPPLHLSAVTSDTRPIMSLTYRTKQQIVCSVARALARSQRSFRSDSRGSRAGGENRIESDRMEPLAELAASRPLGANRSLSSSVWRGGQNR